MQVQFLRAKDKEDVLSVVRDDGSTSWQHQHPGIPVHDLTHFAVESTLGLKDGFYGLLVQGWDISRLTDKDVRTTLPPEGMWTELVVGLIQSERLSPQPLSAPEFNAMLARSCEEFGITIERHVTQAELSRIRTTFADLHSQWNALAPGERLSLEFGQEVRLFPDIPGQ